MNILHLRSSGGFYGAEGVILNLARELNNMNTSNIIVCIDNTKNSHTELLDEARKYGIHTGKIPCRDRIDIQAIHKLRRMLDDLDIDILHCHDYKANFFGILANAFKKRKVVTTNHLWTQEAWILRIYEAIDGIIINFFDAITAVSDAIAAQLKLYVLDTKKISVIYNGIDLNRYSINQNNQNISLKKELNIRTTCFLIGAIGRLSAQKGFEYLIEASRLVLKSNPETHIVIVGDGALRNWLVGRISRSGLEQNVHLLGIRNDMLNIYQGIDIFVSSSIREGLPLVVLEAMAMGKPIIATDVGAVSTIIKNNDTGILITPKNVAQLSNAIITLINNKPLAKNLARRARIFVEENFSSTLMANQYLNIYKKILNQ